MLPTFELDTVTQLIVFLPLTMSNVPGTQQLRFRKPLKPSTARSATVSVVGSSESDEKSKPTQKYHSPTGYFIQLTGLQGTWKINMVSKLFDCCPDTSSYSLLRGHVLKHI